MESKKINQLATEMSPAATDLTIVGDPITGVSKKITLEQIASLFAGSVSFYANLAAFPVTGSIDTIYCAKDTNKLYLWSGSAYVQTFPSQALLDTYQLRSEKGASNGYASLDSLGKVPIAQLPSSLMEYKGMWSAATNTPTLANGTGDTGDVYICNAAGSVNFGAGAITFAVGDYVIYSGSIWQRSSGAVGTVTSVAITESGDSLNITGSPITTSGTINIGFNGTNLQYINGAGNLVTFPSIAAEAQRLITEVYNETGATLSKGTVVYINGGHGNLPTITKAIATGDATSAQTYGIVQTDITNNNNGYVVVIGSLTDLDTQAYIEGTQLYLSSTTAGAWTSVKQYAPAHLVYVAIVTRSHPTQGVVEVRIQNGFEMDELHNVSAQSPLNNQGLFYNTSTSLWENKSIATALGYTPADDSLVVKLAGTQTITGYKTFDAALELKYNVIPTPSSAGYIGIGSNGVGITITTKPVSTVYNNNFYFASASNTFTFPNATGTIALTSNLSSYVPYTGATATVNIGTNSFLSKDISIEGNGTYGGGINIKQYASSILSGAGYTALFATTGTLGILFGAGNSAIISGASLSANRTFTLPDASGTLALTSDLASYVPYTGATTNVNLGVYGITANDYKSGAGWGLSLQSNSTIHYQGAGYVTLVSGADTELSLVFGTGARAIFTGVSISGTKTYTLPDASGTIALTSALSGYLPLTGGTLTGALGGTSATFSSTLRVNGGITTIYDASEARLNLNTDIDGEQNSGWLYADSNATLGSIGNVHIQALSTTVLSVLDYNVYGNNGSNGAVGNVYIGTSVAQGTNNGAVLSLGGWTTSTGSPSAFGRIAGRKENATSGNQAGYLSFETANALVSQSTEKMRITSTGNVGIGVVPSAWGTSVVRGFQVGFGASFSGNSSASDAYMTSNCYYDGSAWKYINTGNNALSFDARGNGGDFIWQNAPIGTAGGTVTFSERMRITSGGNVGIGTSTPLLTATGRGNITLNGATDAIFTFGIAGAYSSYIYSGSDRMEIDAQGSRYMALNTNGQERMRITSGGNVLIGTTTDSGYKLDVNGYGRFSGQLLLGKADGEILKLQSATSTGSTYQRFYNSAGTARGYLGLFWNGTADYMVYDAGALQMNLNSSNSFTFTGGGAATFSSLGTGTVTATSGTLSTVSDMNLKDEDGFIDNALNKVLNLKPRYFHWKKESGLPTDLRQLGFYAQEVNEALGEEAANTPKTENDKWGIYDRGMIAFLTAAIQEQQKQIEELKQLIK